MTKWEPLNLRHHCTKFDALRRYGKGDTTSLTCHVTSRDDIIKRKSKAFDKVWHDGLMYKLKRLGICGKYFRLIHSFLNDRHQRVVLNGQYSNWSKIKAGVPQGSILGPLFFLVYINDLPEGLTTNAKLFADDTSLLMIRFYVIISFA